MKKLKRENGTRRAINLYKNGVDEEGTTLIGPDAPDEYGDFGIERELDQTGLYLHTDGNFIIWFFYTDENGENGQWEQYMTVDTSDEDYNMGMNIPWQNKSETELVAAMYFQSQISD